MKENVDMKKSTEELILTQLLTINTEIVKIHSELGYVKQDIKSIQVDIKDIRQEMKEGFIAVREEMREIRDELKEELKIETGKIWTEIKEINMKLDWAGEKIFVDHEKRLELLEAAA